MWKELSRHISIREGLSEAAASRIINSLRTSTKNQYANYIRKFCLFNKKHLELCTHADLIEYIEHLYSVDKLGYSACNMARSAVSTFLELFCGNGIGKHPLVCRYMKGIFQSRPALPRYATTWNPEVVLKVLNEIDSHSATLLELSRKLAVLLTLLSGQRVATVSSLKLQDVQFSTDVSSMFIHVTDLVKQSKPGMHQQPLCFAQYKANSNLCVILAMKIYIEKTKSLRGEIASLWLTTTTPTKPACKDTVSNWIRNILKRAGLDSFKPHSLRGAGTSAAAKILPLDTILKAGGWSSSSTFAKFYKKPTHVYKGIDHAILQCANGNNK